MPAYAPTRGSVGSRVEQLLAVEAAQSAFQNPRAQRAPSKLPRLSFRRYLIQPLHFPSHARTHTERIPPAGHIKSLARRRNRLANADSGHCAWRHIITTGFSVGQCARTRPPVPADRRPVVMVTVFVSAAGDGVRRGLGTRAPLQFYSLCCTVRYRCGSNLSTAKFKDMPFIDSIAANNLRKLLGIQ